MRKPLSDRARMSRRSSRSAPARASRSARPRRPTASTSRSSARARRGCGCASIARRRTRADRSRSSSTRACIARYGFWHVFVAGARAGWLYTWRADGPNEPAAGLRFDARRELLDPWARLVSDARLGSRGRRRRRPRVGAARRDRAAADDYDWEGDRAAASGRCETPSSTSCTSAASRGIRRRGVAAARHVSRARSRRFRTCRRSASRTSSCCPCSRSTRRTCRRATAAIGLRQLLGLQPRELFRAASRTTPPATTRGASFATW